MIVLDGGDNWHLVLQPHHGDLAGQLAAAWGNDEFDPPRHHDSLVVAAARHDDGWAVWERWPEVHDDGRPASFLEAGIPSHLAFYGAAITDVTQRDPYAGLMVAMHGAGLYRQRYDTNPQMGVLAGSENHRQPIDAFLTELESSYPQRRADLGIDEDEQWANYKLLQVFDRAALYFSGFPKTKDDDVVTIDPVPVDYSGTETEMRFTPLSAFEPLAPSHVRVDPYPFAESPARFMLERRVLPKRTRTDEEFRRELVETPTERVEIRAER
jgi:uncharacterized protein DUF3891